MIKLTMPKSLQCTKIYSDSNATDSDIQESSYDSYANTPHDQSQSFILPVMQNSDKILDSLNSLFQEEIETQVQHL